MRLRLYLFLLIAAVFAVLGAARTQADVETEAALLRRIEAYLNGITSLAADFLQINHDGSISKGTIAIARPGRMRIDYAAPLMIRIISTGGWITYIDRDLGQISQTPLHGTPADLLLRRNLRFGGDAVVNAVKRRANVIEITVTRRESPSEGSMTLLFADNPLELRQWVVVDAQRLTTRVTLLNSRFGLPLDPALFDAPPPFPEGDK